MALRCWLSAALPFLELRSQASHGFRSGFQADELQAVVRTIFEKRKQWGLPALLAKLDIARAYGAVSLSAMDWVFERCQVPHFLRAAYWRMHTGRTLVFRVSRGSTTFEVVPEHGMPQGAPESPAIYACLMEELLKVATATLEANDVPAGVGLPEDEDEETAEDIDRLRRQDRIIRPALHACNFADDAYLFASGCRQLSYMTTGVGET